MRELFHLSGFGFTYPQQRTPALTDVELTIRSGEFWVLCGPSGCGKSTLLRQLKTVLAPHGVTEGEVYFQGTPLREIPLRQQAADIGFVLQSPEQQVVTDKVWHELAFGLESLGYDTPTIRRRVAEMAGFFGMESWFHRETASLSGGQKQLLNLAAVLTLNGTGTLADLMPALAGADADTWLELSLRDEAGRACLPRDGFGPDAALPLTFSLDGTGVLPESLTACLTVQSEGADDPAAPSAEIPLAME